MTGLYNAMAQHAGLRRRTEENGPKLKALQAEGRIFMLLVRARSVMLIAAAAFMVLPLAGHAHSTKEATVPADGSVLTTAPETIVMEFDMPMRVTMISLTDQDGSEHELTRTDAMEPVTEFQAHPPVLPPGTYRIDWRGMAEDGHAMQGSFRFELRD